LLVSFSLPNLREGIPEIGLSRNTRLESVNFPGVTRVSNLGVDINAALTSLSGFSALTSAGRLTIIDNPVLASLAGLSSLTAVNGNLTIYRNAVLPPASVDAFLAGVDVTGTITLVPP